MHFLKRNLVYLAEDYGFDYDDFSNYLFVNFRDYVWGVHDGVEYCHANDAKWLAQEYLGYKSAVAEYYGA